MILSTASFNLRALCSIVFASGILRWLMLNHYYEVKDKIFYLSNSLFRSSFFMGQLLFAYWLPWFICWSWSSILQTSIWSCVCLKDSKIPIGLEPIWTSLFVSCSKYSLISNPDSYKSFCWFISCFWLNHWKRHWFIKILWIFPTIYY